MIKNWKSSTIRELQIRGEAELKTGPFGTQLHASDYTEVGTPVINVRNLGYGNIREENLEFISNETVGRLADHLLQPGDIVFGRKGAVDRHAFIQQKHTLWFQGSDCLRLRLKSSTIDPRFVSYCFLTDQHKQWMLTHCSHGSTMASLNQDILSRIELRLPPFLIQRRIADILGALDDKIEVNRRINRRLEAMAQALFKHWFVDFGPFQDGQFVESELGLVPEGWEIRPLDQIAHFLNGLALQKYPPENPDEYLPVIKIAEMRRGVTKASGRASPHIDRKYSVEDSDVLFSWSGSLDVCLWSGGRGALNQHLFKVTSIHYPKWFFYRWVQHYLTEFRKIAADKATTMGHIQRYHLSDAKVLVPSNDSLKAMDDRMAPLLEQFIQNQIESRKLEEIRDYLLPRLLSGEISVEAAEEAVADGG